MSENLRIAKISDLFLIPKYLVNQVKDVYWTPEELYSLWPTAEGNLGNLLFAIVNEDHIIKGFIWLSVVPLGKILFINAVSLDKEIQHKGLLKNLIKPYIQKVKEKLGDPKIITASARSRALHRLGMKPTKVLMEA